MMNYYLIAVLLLCCMPPAVTAKNLRGLEWDPGDNAAADANHRQLAGRQYNLFQQQNSQTMGMMSRKAMMSASKKDARTGRRREPTPHTHRRPSWWITLGDVTFRRRGPRPQNPNNSSDKQLTAPQPNDIAEPTTGCYSDSDCMESDTCEANRCVASGNPVFRLIWSGDDDLDLHVITPAGNEISFANPSVDSGILDQDDIPIDDGFPNRTEWVESIFFPIDGSAPSGTYTYFVHNFAEQGDSADPWELRVLVGNEIVATQTGLLGNKEFTVEFTYEHTQV